MGISTSPSKPLVWGLLLIWGVSRIPPGPYPPILDQLNPLTIGVISPLFAILEGVAIAWMWEGIRKGFTLAIALAIVAVLLSLGYALASFSAGQLLPLGTTALSNIIIGAVAGVAAWRARR